MVKININTNIFKAKKDQTLSLYSDKENSTLFKVILNLFAFGNIALKYEDKADVISDLWSVRIIK